MRNITLLLLLSCSFISAQSNHPLKTKDYVAQQKWVDSVYNSLTVKERIGQLFMPMVFSSQTEEEHQEIIRQIKENKIGGLIFSKGGPIRQAKLTNEYQATS